MIVSNDEQRIISSQENIPKEYQDVIDKIEAMPPDLREIILRQHMSITATMHEVPSFIIPPDMLQQNELTLAGSAERTFAMIEKEQAHAHRVNEQIVEINKKIVQGDISQAKRGSYLAVFVIMFTVCAGIGAYIVTKSEAVALAVIGVAGLGIASELIKSHKK